MVWIEWIGVCFVPAEDANRQTRPQIRLDVENGCAEETEVKITINFFLYVIQIQILEIFFYSSQRFVSSLVDCFWESMQLTFFLPRSNTCSIWIWNIIIISNKMVTSKNWNIFWFICLFAKFVLDKQAYHGIYHIRRSSRCCRVNNRCQGNRPIIAKSTLINFIRISSYFIWWALRVKTIYVIWSFI